MKIRRQNNCEQNVMESTFAKEASNVGDAPSPILRIRTEFEFIDLGKLCCNSE